jgi:hypothetical protein
MSNTMSTPNRTPVYKCIIPVEQPRSIWSPIFRSIFPPRKKTQRLPYPAWPYIDQANQPCCLPTLMRAVFFVTHSIDLSHKDVERRTKEYLARQENIEPEVREFALATVKAQQKRARGLAKARRSLQRLAKADPSLSDIWPLKQPSIFLEPPAFSYLQGITEQVMVVPPGAWELSMQALIYGEFDHFVDHKDAFSFAHEYGHQMAKGFDSSKELEALAYNSQIMLGRLAILEELTAEEIDELWEQFESIRGHIDDLVQKFEPIEEIFATYVGLRCLPVDARNKVEPLVKEELIKRGWDKVYEAFVKRCEDFSDSIEAAAFICEPACLVLLLVNMDGLELLRIFLEIHRIICLTIRILLDMEQDEGNILDRLGVENELDLLTVAERVADGFINRLLDDADIPRELYWSVSQTVHDRQKERVKLITEAFRNNDFSDLGHKLGYCCTHIVLIGSPADEYISSSIGPCEREEKEWPAVERIFFESLAQQILKKSCLLVCPNSPINTKTCCGRREELERLYERLPEKYKKHISLPNCVRVR